MNELRSPYPHFWGKAVTHHVRWRGIARWAGLNREWVRFVVKEYASNDSRAHSVRSRRAGDEGIRRALGIPIVRERQTTLYINGKAVPVKEYRFSIVRDPPDDLLGDSWSNGAREFTAEATIPVVPDPEPAGGAG